MSRSLLVAALPLFLVTLAGCPKNPPLSEIPQLQSLDDIMWSQQGIAGPQFKKAGQSTFTEAEWDAFADAALRIQATSVRIKEFSAGRKEGFVGATDELTKQATALLDASKAKDVAGAKNALEGMKQACKNCHSNYK